MNTKKILTILFVLLLLANTVIVSLLWFKKDKTPMPLNGGPAKFIIKELGFDKKQQEQFLALARAHQEAIMPIREELKNAKNSFFSLLSKPNVSEADKQTDAKAISAYTEKIDLITLNHFAQVRAMCNPEQQQKFDGIIKQVTQMMGAPGLPHPQHPPMDGPDGHRPPPEDFDGEMPPPSPHN